MSVIYIVGNGAGTIKAPATSLTIEVWGSGASGNDDTGAGGPGGGYSSITLTTTVGQTLTFDLGSPGIWGTNGAQGVNGNGNDTWISTTGGVPTTSIASGVIAPGGGSTTGSLPSSTFFAGGAGGTAAGFSGGGGGGGAGGPAPAGAGKAGGNGSTSGGNGGGGGGGGSGGSTSTVGATSSGLAGGAGGNGVSGTGGAGGTTTGGSGANGGPGGGGGGAGSTASGTLSNHGGNGGNDFDHGGGGGGGAALGSAGTSLGGNGGTPGGGGCDVISATGGTVGQGGWSEIKITFAGTAPNQTIIYGTFPGTNSAGWADTVTASDSYTATVITPTVFAKSLTDTLTATDTTSATAAPSAHALSDTAAPTDTLASASQAGRSLSDTAAATDQITATASPSAHALSDTAAPTDALSAAAQAARALSDTAAPTDALSAAAQSARALSDTAAPSDTLAATAAAFAHALTDTASASDTLSAVTSSTFVLALSDTITASDGYVPTASATASLSDDLAFQRASTATYFDATGTLQSAAPNVERTASYTWNGSAWVGPSTLLEGASTNGVFNPRCEGVVPGTPGTLPTDWFNANGTGLTVEVVDSGVESGIEYVDVRWFGTTLTNSNDTFYFCSFGDIPALIGQTWTVSNYISVIAAPSPGGVTVAQVNTRQLNSSLGFVGTGWGTAAIPVQALPTSLSQARIASTGTTDGVGAAYIFLRSIVFAPGDGSAVDFTLRFGGPQVEQQPAATSLILPPSGSPGASMRAADVPGTLQDTLAAAAQSAARLADTSAATDQLASAAAPVAAIQDIVAASDHISTAAAYPLSLTDTVAAVDLLGSASQSSHPLSDTVAAADTFANTPPHLSLADTPAVSDSISSTATFAVIPLADTATPTDIIRTVGAGQFFYGLSDTLAATDSLSTTTAPMPAAISDGRAPTDTLVPTVRVAPISLADTPAVLETYASTARYTYALSDTIAAADITAGSVNFAIARSDAITATDGLLSTAAAMASLSDNLGIFQRASTATYFDATGTLQTAAVNVERTASFTWNGTSWVGPSTLIEGAATNVAFPSGDLSQWSAGSCVVTSDSTIAPDGTLTAAQLAYTSVSAGFSAVYHSFPITPQAYTISIWLKGAVGGELVYLMFNSDTFISVACHLTTSWQRFSCTSTQDTTSCFFELGWDSRDTAQGPFPSPTQTIYAWGAQFEAGAAATSYIPTTTAPGTRAADFPGLNDTLTAAAQSAASLSDTAAATDRLSPAVAAPTSISDTIAVSDTLSGHAAVSEILTDNLSATDALQAAPNLLAALHDLVATSEILVSAASFAPVQVSDTLAPADTFQLHAPGVFSLSLSDGINPVDGLSSAAAVMRAVLSENATPSDLLSPVATSSASIGDTVAAFDALAPAAASSYQITDNVAIAEGYASSALSAHVLSDAAAPADVLKAGAAFATSVSDTAAASDSITTAAAFYASLADAVPATDDFGYVLTLMGVMRARVPGPRASVQAQSLTGLFGTVSARTLSPHASAFALFSLLDQVQVVAVPPDIRTVQVPKDT